MMRGGGKVQMMLDGSSQMEDWLKSKGLGRFTDHFLEFGIENIVSNTAVSSAVCLFFQLLLPKNKNKNIQLHHLSIY
jgi:hypothetical protein